ncbi:MAG: hypothetical protein JSR64_15765 [Nitrospira sp.]|nr:hypothetical protein [Nitrospira sp.]
MSEHKLVKTPSYEDAAKSVAMTILFGEGTKAKPKDVPADVPFNVTFEQLWRPIKRALINGSFVREDA